MATKDKLIDEEDIANLLNEKDAKNNKYVALFHGSETGASFFYYTSSSFQDILQQIAVLFIWVSLIFFESGEKFVF